MPIVSTRLSILPDDSHISFWVSKEASAYAHLGQEALKKHGMLLDILSKQIVGSIAAWNHASAITWNSSGAGAYATSRIEKPNHLLRILDAESSTVTDEFETPHISSNIRWLTPNKLMFVSVESESNNLVDFPRSLHIIDLHSKEITTVDTSKELLQFECLCNGDIWCGEDLRHDFSCSRIYSITGKRVVWASPDDRLDFADAISPDGKILILNAYKNAFSVVGQIIRHPSRAKRMIPALVGKIVQPTSASVIDGRTGRIIWNSLPGEVMSGTFGIGSSVALSVVLSQDRYGVVVCNTDIGSETIIADSDRPMEVVGETKHGWIIVEDENTIRLVNGQRNEILFTCNSMQQRDS